jgi:DHA1 family solute carrier family 18 vesicular amine transporter 1/2
MTNGEARPLLLSSATDHRPHRLATLVLCSLAAFVDVLSFSIVVPLIPFLEKKLHMSPSLVGTMMAMYGLGSVAASPLSGWMARLLSGRVMLCIGAVILSVSSLSVVLLPSLPMLFVARFAQGASCAITWTAAMGLIAAVFRDSDREAAGPATGWLQSMPMAQADSFVTFGISAGVLVGPPLGGFLFDHVRKAAPFWACTVTAALGAVLFLVFLPKDPNGGDDDRKHRSLAETCRLLFATRESAYALLVYFAEATITTMLDPIVPLLADDRFPTSPTWVGVLFAVTGVTYALTSVALGKWAKDAGYLKLMACGLYGMAVGLGMLCAADNIWVTGMGMGVVWVGAGFIATSAFPSITASLEKAGVQDEGVAAAASNLAYFLGMIAGPALGGLLANSRGSFEACFGTFAGFSGLLLVIKIFV